MGRDVILEGRQRDPGQWHEAARHLGEEITLLMGRQQNIEFAAGEQVQPVPAICATEVNEATRLNPGVAGNGPAPTFATFAVKVTVPPGTKFPLCVNVTLRSGGGTMVIDTGSEKELLA